MTDQITGGHFLMSRMIYTSAIWKKPPQYFRLFLLFIGKAVFRDGYIFKGHVLKRGQLVITYSEIAEALSYRFNRAVITPSAKEIRIMLSWLQSEGMILMKPLIDGTSANQGGPIELTRAYIGLLITVVNYDTYQDFESYKGGDKGGPSFEQGQLEEHRDEEKPLLSDSPKSDLSDFETFCKAYPKHEARKKAMDAWMKIHPDKDLQSAIFTAIEKQKAHKAGLKSQGAFCPAWPLPATWLNGRRWEDEWEDEVEIKKPRGSW